jgi:hypothetical protein
MTVRIISVLSFREFNYSNGDCGILFEKFDKLGELFRSK